MFPFPNEVQNCLMSRTPFFICKLNDTNLKARGCLSVLEYFQNYSGMIRQFSTAEKRRIYRICESARRRCLDNKLRHLLRVNWKFCKCDNMLEDGYPHTVGDIVMLPEHVLGYADEGLLRLIVHEITHVFQRELPLYAAEEVHGLGFVPVRRWGEHRDSLRANPDTDDLIYALKDIECNPVLRQGATSLSEICLLPHFEYPGFEHIRNPEHPFEIIAEMNASKV